MSQQGDNPDPVQMHDSTDGSEARVNNDSSSAPTSTPAAPIPTTQNASPFLCLPLELRRVVYRHLLVAKNYIHLDCFLPHKPNAQWCKCKRALKICTALLRVCRQTTPEALDVLYGENGFAVKVDNYPPECEMVTRPPVIEAHFSEANRSRLRKLIMKHECCWEYIAFHDEDDDSMESWYGDIPEMDRDLPKMDTKFSPYDVGGILKSEIWAPIIANLTNLTIMLTVPCCGPDDYPYNFQDSLFDVSEQSELDERAADLKSALAFYRLQVHIPASVRVRRVVWCTDHRCGCGRDKEFGGCAKVHRYFRRVWGKAMALEAEEDLALAATAGTASGDQ